MDYYERQRMERKEFLDTLVEKANSGEHVWGYAFEIGHSSGGRRNRHYPPTEGIMILKGYFYDTPELVFRPLGKRGPKASGDRVYRYNDGFHIVFTEKECNEEYKILVNARIEELQYQIDELKSLI